MTPRSKRSRRRVLSIFTAAIIGVLIICGVSELVLRQIVPNRIADGVREALQLSEDHPVEVGVSGMLLPQLVAGRFNRVSIASDDVPLGDTEVRADVTGVARDLPLNIEQQELGHTRISATLSEEQLQAALTTLSRGMEFDLDISGSKLTVATSLNLFGQKIPVTVRFVPSLTGDGLHIEPISVDAAGLISLDVDELANFQLLAPIADGVDLCYDDLVPQGVHLSDLSLSTTRSMRVSATIDPRIMLDPALQEVGECSSRSAQIP